jgi:Family of unknown function (DUF6452)/Prokaryotic membrane lipoprotein lipid attachment site
MKQILLILLITFTLSGCEKDDICDPATATTPSLVIEFYDADSPNNPQTVTNLRVIAPGFTNPISGTTGVNKITIPLKTAEDSTTFHFIENGGDADTSDDNTDVLQFTYTRESIFVSRACGYKVNFDLTNTNTNLLTSDTDNWIQSITITQPNIETENETHIKIYF